MPAELATRKLERRLATYLPSAPSCGVKGVRNTMPAKKSKVTREHVGRYAWVLETDVGRCLACVARDARVAGTNVTTSFVHIDGCTQAGPPKKKAATAPPPAADPFAAAAEAAERRKAPPPSTEPAAVPEPEPAAVPEQEARAAAQPSDADAPSPAVRRSPRAKKNAFDVLGQKPKGNVAAAPVPAPPPGPAEEALQPAAPEAGAEGWSCDKCGLWVKHTESQLEKQVKVFTGGLTPGDVSPEYAMLEAQAYRSRATALELEHAKV